MRQPQAILRNRFLVQPRAIDPLVCNNQRERRGDVLAFSPAYQLNRPTVPDDASVCATDARWD